MIEHRIVVLVWLTYSSVIPAFATFSLTFFSAGSKYVWKSINCLASFGTLIERKHNSPRCISVQLLAPHCQTGVECFVASIPCFSVQFRFRFGALNYAHYTVEQALLLFFHSIRCSATSAKSIKFSHFPLNSNQNYSLFRWFHLSHFVDSMELNLLPFATNCSNLPMMIFVATKSSQSIGSYSKPSFNQII